MLLARLQSGDSMAAPGWSFDGASAARAFSEFEPFDHVSKCQKRQKCQNKEVFLIMVPNMVLGTSEMKQVFDLVPNLFFFS